MRLSGQIYAREPDLYSYADRIGGRKRCSDALDATGLVFCGDMVAVSARSSA
jgi:hypothetical protein